MIIINNSPKTDLELDDGYFLSHGVFETMLVLDGKGMFLQEHIIRLNKGINFLSIKTRISEKEVLEKIRYFYHALKVEKFVLKIHVSDKNVVYSTKEYSYKHEDYFHANLGISEIRRGNSPIHCYKTTNMLENSLELRKGKENGCIDVLLLNMKEEILEGCISNVFFVYQNKIMTPTLESGILDGVMRRWVINNFAVQEEVITKEFMEKADGVFITNSLMGIMPIKTLVNKTLGSFQNKVIQSVYQQYCSLCKFG